ncbi:RNA-binding protein [Methylobacter sp.]|uniref:RNA recognition motif domain-containing protein n=1 Tax=Methylobacter sp. TaxID=2051955 RepID=UPI0011F52C2B|nr:RNA-binding protein [Methylobacter sp.]TAK61292.1 MAG: RNA-binding protein [Methylobacter sp.]
MLVFFKNIPPTTQKSDLIEVIKPAIKRNLFYRLFSLPGTIVDITLLNLLDNEQNILNAHGVVTIMPDDVASLVIKQLDRKVVNGRRITVREYHIRSEQNDPRRASNDIPQDIIDQRVGDRRQYKLVPCLGMPA